MSKKHQIINSLLTPKISIRSTSTATSSIASSNENSFQKYTSSDPVLDNRALNEHNSNRGSLGPKTSSRCYSNYTKELRG